MDFKVASTMKGKFVVNSLGRSFRAEEKFTISEEDALDPGIQFAVQNKMIEPLDPFTEAVCVEFRNISKNKINICKLLISSQQTFQVSSKMAESHEILDAIKSGLIIKEDKSAIKKAKEEAIKSLEKAIRKAKRIKNREDMSVAEKLITPPEDVYIARPDLRPSPKLAEKNQIIDLSSEDTNQGIEFVDHKQTQERLVKLQKAVKSRNQSE